MTGLTAPVVKVDGWSDWTVTPSWSDGTRTMTATIGHGLPMTYFKVAGGGAAADRERYSAGLAERRRHGRLHRQRPRLCRLRADRLRLDRRPATS